MNRQKNGDDRGRQLEEFKRVLENMMDIPYETSIQKATCAKVAAALSSDELDVAASTSYTYWWLTKQKDHGLSDEYMRDARQQMAMRECKRHCIGEGGDFKRTLSAVKEAIQYRLQYDIDSVRACTEFANDPTYPPSMTTRLLTTNNNPVSLNELKAMILDELANKQAMVVRGYGKEQHAIVYKHPRTVPTKETDEHAFILANLYVAERAVAATEYITKGRKEKLIVIFNFVGYDSANAPPSRLEPIFAKLMRRAYPERLERFFFLEPSFWLRLVYNIIYPFLGYETRKKITFVTNATSAEKKLATFSDVVDLGQATPHLLEGGELSSPLNMEQYVNNVPFHILYDG